MSRLPDESQQRVEQSGHQPARDQKHAHYEPPLHKKPQIRYLVLADIRRLLVYLKGQQNGYGPRSRFNLPMPLPAAGRFDELIQLSWSDCQRVGEHIVALRIRGKGSVFQDVPVSGA